VSKVFLDTNVFIYALDDSDARKQARARACLKGVMERGDGVISTQVLQEYYVVATRKLGVEAAAAKGQVQALGRLETVLVTPELIQEAIDGCVAEKISFWDSLLVAAARFAGCAEIYTEDLNAGQIIRGVEVTNPLKD